ncbi:MAG: SAM-dependent methyltransferase, partial [Undibacterium sp.]|nr:SAM-dependent methyltransferase [Undibacterium sp.]
IMEFGAGSGKLAFDILSECQHSHFPLDRYFIVELSGELKARQEALLKDFPQVVWLSSMPEAFSGVVLGNEVLDAMPVELVIKSADGWKKLGVSVNSHQELDFSLLTMDMSEQSWAEQLAQIPDAESLPIGYITEIHPIACAFMNSIAHMLIAGKDKNQLGGAAIWIDYGFPAHEYYAEQREKGTLMCHYRHHAHPDPFYLPGLQDITAHVDFSAIAKSGVLAGLDLLAYTSQAGFLLQAGLAEVLGRIPVEDTQNYLPASNIVNKYISPAEMGELFKVLILACAIECPNQLLQHDRSHRL